MKAPVLAPHEYTANYLYADDGLKPFFACDSRVKDGSPPTANAGSAVSPTSPRIS